MKTKAIVILGGGLLKGNDGVWHSTVFDDHAGASGGKLRIVAGYHLHQLDNDSIIIASGGVGLKRIDINDAPTLSSVIKKELIELGVKEEQIYEESSSDTTYQQLVKLKTIVKEREIKQLIIVSSRYHTPRVRAFIDFLPDLHSLSDNCQVEVVDAEKVLLEADPDNWKKLIDKVYTSSGMQERIRLETQGIEQIKAGTYKII